MEGLTISEMATILGIKPHSVTVRLNRAGIKPITQEAIYDPAALETIKSAKRGRPSKPLKAVNKPPRPR
ncbi:MAG: hypothetical protein LBT00_08920 [Spirochaetaceae bacterium]|jgi:hypothetical protein|nr:hypothetical protein [Spirochaetaceae bacterium]